MIRACKLCANAIPVPKYGENWWCSKCQQYSISYLDNSLVESEVLRVDNFVLIFFPSYREANVVEVSNGEKKLLKTIPMNELTHEAVAQWVKKLKTYVLFQ